ncbi:methylamine utilization protein [Pseudemcibacter aquimaris]|uniref:methylamine utilization protein n=1 Tax=Pseudemcibacter aquimaris TaxID=2857064 RepID=UPI0020137185|nr:methylamine utilization protein [Pseudemcibacter aquimaris]MCC3861079.1 methylamine utilization protein [Pseudemcibacter aquimaris]WDU59897.1 methylamine utilization protein [Pseudemcibacter aquimaris]
MAFIMVSVANAATLSGTVKDKNGKDVEFAVITLIGENVAISGDNTHMPSPVMSQKNIKFTPFVLPVSKGSTVSFPNRDNIRHHVYSFSKVKRFELELYNGDEEKSVHFDKEGVVALGCNIHDSMLAYIYIVPSNKFSTTGKNGSLVINDIPAGTYKAQVWHPRLKGNIENYEKEITLSDDQSFQLDFEIDLKRERKRRNRGTY